jgi:branched-chain amino acid transport system permease protein
MNDLSSHMTRLASQLSRRATAAAADTRAARPRRAGLGGVALAVLGVIPFAALQVPWLLPGPVDVLNSDGTLEVLGLCCIFGGLALSFDLLLGFTGLLSFGQALFFATGVYVLDIALSAWHWALIPAAAVTVATGLVLALLVGCVGIRVRGIAFAMVTLAFAQAGYYLIEDNPHGLTGGDTGLVMSTSRLPAMLVGVISTRNLYWLALLFLGGAYALTWLTTESVTGRVFLAIRESERRTEVLGFSPFPVKLASFVLSSLIATVAGMFYLVLVGTAAPGAVASTTVTVSILVMVVLGGVGTRWGAVLGAFVYVYLQQYLLKVAAEPSFAGLPAVVRVPVSQPDVLLGALFIAFVLFAPGGLAGLAARIRTRWQLRRRAGAR